MLRREVVGETGDDGNDEAESLERRELQRIQKLLSSTSTTTSRIQLDAAPPPPPPPAEQSQDKSRGEDSQQQTDDEQSQQQQQQQRRRDEGEERDEKQQPLDAEDNKEVESENNSGSENVAERQSPQQPNCEKQDTTTVSSQADERRPAQQPDTRRTERPASGPRQTVRVQMKHGAAAPAPAAAAAAEKKQQQVAVVHARSHPALSRVQRQQTTSIESHLSIESASSHQLSQASLLWRNQEIQQPGAGADSSWQQYEQLRYELQQQLEAQRSQLEREYQLREERMRQTMMMQWQYLTHQQQQPQQQQQQQQWSGHLLAGQVDQRSHGFPPDPLSANINGTAGHPVHAESTGSERRRGCNDVVSANVGGLAHCGVRPLVVDVVSHSRGGGGGARSGRDGGGHCRIVVGERAAAATESATAAEPPTDWRVCDSSDDGKNAAVHDDERDTGHTVRA